MSDDVNIKISATDNATATLRAVQAQLNSFSASIKNIAGFAIGGYGLSQLASFAGDSIKAYGESERAVTMLDRVLKSTGNTIKMTRAEIQAYAEARMAQTVFDDDAIVEAASQLARFRDIAGETFTGTLDAAQDLATVMGTDLVSATQMLGRALSDPADGLSKLARAGVLFTDSQKEQIKTLNAIGDKAGQQRIILEELRRQFGGAAIDDASTASGQIKQLSNAIGELKEAIGGTLAGAIMPLVNQINGKESSATAARRAVLQSQVTPQDSKLAEQNAIDSQIGELDGRIRAMQKEVSDFQKTTIGALGGFSDWVVNREWHIQQMRERQRGLWNQRDEIALQATSELAGQTSSAAVAASIRNAMARTIEGIAAAAGGATIGKIMGDRAAVTAESAGSRVAFELYDIVTGQKRGGGAASDPSLQAVESRFLTRGRGQLSMADRKQAEDAAKQLAQLKRIEDAVKAMAENAVLIVEGVG